MKLSLSVIGIHLLLVLIAFLSPIAKKEHKERLVVKTMSLPSKQKIIEKPQTVNAQKPKIEKPKAVQPAPAPVKKPVPAKPIPSKKKIAPVKAKPKKEKVAETVVPGHLLRELEETIAKIDEKRDKLSTSKKSKPVNKIEPLQSESFHHLESERNEVDYKETLVMYLHQSLNLPDFGDVKIQVTLRQDGSVENLKVLKAESDKNRKYLEMHLPLLKFPPLQGSSGKKENTFILTFCNEL